MSKKIIALSAVLLLAPALAHAAEGYVYDLGFLPEALEEILEIVNLILSILAATFAIKLAALSQGGELEKTWNGLALGAGFFALLEVYGSLQGFGFVHIEGFGDVIEAAMVITFLYVFYTTRKTLLKRVLGK